MYIKNGTAYAETLNDITAVNLAKHLAIVTYNEPGHEQVLAVTQVGYKVLFTSSLTPAFREYLTLAEAKESLIL